MSSSDLNELQKSWFAEDTGGSTDPTSSIDWLNAGSKVLGSALGGAMSSPPTTSTADSVFSTNSDFDNSGWNVNFGSGSINSTSSKANSQGGASGLSGNLSTYLPWILAFVGSLLVWKKLNK